MTNNNDEEIGNNIFIPSFWVQHGFQTQTEPAYLTGLIVNRSWNWFLMSDNLLFEQFERTPWIVVRPEKLFELWVGSTRSKS